MEIFWDHRPENRALNLHPETSREWRGMRLIFKGLEEMGLIKVPDRLKDTLQGGRLHDVSPVPLKLRLDADEVLGLMASLQTQQEKVVRGPQPPEVLAEPADLLRASTVRNPAGTAEELVIRLEPSDRLRELVSAIRTGHDNRDVG
jgi:hypothetical protein